MIFNVRQGPIKSNTCHAESETKVGAKNCWKVKKIGQHLR